VVPAQILHDATESVQVELMMERDIVEHSPETARYLHSTSAAAATSKTLAARMYGIVVLEQVHNTTMGR
jgi:hypothetical protein